MILQVLIYFFLSIITSFLFILIIKTMFIRYWIVDNPQKYNKKRKPIPYSTWVVFFISFFILSFFFLEHSYKLYLIWIFGFLITIVSFVDDILKVNAKFRLLFQIIIWAIIGITSIKIWYVSNIFWWIIDLETYSFVVFDHIIYITQFGV